MANVAVKKCEELQKDHPSSLRSLSQFEANALADIMAMDGDEEVMQLKCGDSVRACDMKLLLSGGWLNSEVINTYMTLIEVKYCNLRPVVQYSTWLGYAMADMTEWIHGLMNPAIQRF